MIKTTLVNGRTGKKARVTEYGELVTGRYDYSTPVYNSLSVTDTAYNFFVPKMDTKLVITDILIDAGRNVSNTTPATIDIFEAEGLEDATISKQLLKVELLKNSYRDLTGLNFIVSAGRWVNAKTDDATVSITIAGYYISTDDLKTRRGA